MLGDLSAKGKINWANVEGARERKRTLHLEKNEESMYHALCCTCFVVARETSNCFEVYWGTIHGLEEGEIKTICVPDKENLSPTNHWEIFTTEAEHQELSVLIIV